MNITNFSAAGAVALSLGLGAPAAAGTLTGVDLTNTAINQFIEIDTTTGAGTSVVTFSSRNNVGKIAFAPDGQLFATKRGSSDNTLMTVDPATGDVTDIGNASGIVSLGDLAFNSGGTLFSYGAVPSSEGGALNLLTIDTATGAATLVGETGLGGMNGLAFSSTGTLYGLSSSLLVTLDPTTGAETSRVSLNPDKPANNFARFGNLSFVEGELFSIDRRLDELVSINTATGDVTSIGELGFDGIRTLSTAPATAPVPLPAPAGFLLVGLGALGVMRSWRAHAA